MEFELIPGNSDQPEGFVVFYTAIISDCIPYPYRASFGMPLSRVVSENPRFWIVKDHLDIGKGVPDDKRPISLLSYFEEEKIIDTLRKIGGWDIYKSRSICELVDNEIDTLDEILAEHSYEYIELYFNLINSRKLRGNFGKLPETGLDDIPGWNR